MRYSEDIKSITYMKTSSADLVKQVRARRRPMIITQNGEAKVVVQDIRSYERDQNTLLLLNLISQGVRDAEEGKMTEHDAVMAKLEGKIRRQASQ